MTPQTHSTQRGGSDAMRNQEIFFSQQMILEDLRLVRRRLCEGTLLIYPEVEALVHLLDHMINIYEGQW